MENFLFELSIIIAGAAVLSVLAVFIKQPIIIAYILCGILFGPWGAGLVKNVAFIEGISHLGVTLLLFLTGLCLHPQKLIALFKKTTLVTIANAAGSFLVAFAFAWVFSFSLKDSLCIGLALMFSSTILVVKLLPTTELHHKQMGAVAIGVLILQDLLAIGVLAFIRCLDSPQGVLYSFAILNLKLAAFIVALVFVEYYVLRKIMLKVERMHEVLFILGLAWCLGIASVSQAMGLFYETGAFFSGVVLARHPISRFISESLKPIRDFFLVLFFFTLGAKLDVIALKNILLPALLLCTILMLVKTWLFRKSFILSGETPVFAKEAGLRLGQLSEFSLLIALLAFELGHLSNAAAQLIQVTTILSFVVSCYIVVLKCPTPIGTSEKLKRD